LPGTAAQSHPTDQLLRREVGWSPRRLPEICSSMRNLFGGSSEVTFRGSTSLRALHEGNVSIMTSLLLRALFGLAAIATFAYGASAAQPFDPTAFRQAQAAGKTILVDVTAPWCPTCRQQKPIIQAIESENPSLVVYEVDFDTAKDVLKRFHVQHQSTLIVFKGAKEVGRSTGETDPAGLRTLVAKGL
jgi:thioredoxin 1